MSVQIGTLDCIVEILKLFISTVLELNMFLKKFIGNKNIKAHIFSVQWNNSIMCEYFCIGFINFISERKMLIDYTGLFSPYSFKEKRLLFLYLFKEWINSVLLKVLIPLIWTMKKKLNKINGIRDYFDSEIQERKAMSKKLSKLMLLIILKKR